MPSQVQQEGAFDEEAQRRSCILDDLEAKEDGTEPDSSAASDVSGTPIERLDWESPEDPGNPLLWPAWKKVFHTAIPALIGFAL